MLGADALANAQRFGIAIAIHVLCHGIAEVFPQRAVGHVQPLVGAQAVRDLTAEPPLQHLDAGERVHGANARQVVGVAGHNQVLISSMFNAIFCHGSAAYEGRVPA